MLRCAHHLKTLDFYEGISLLSDFSENDDLMNPVPHCLLNEVKSIKIKEFSVHMKALYAVMYLLKTALVLDKMTIICYKNSEKLQKKVTELLNQFSNGSEICEVIVYSAEH
ncbi:uncharacterized protein LOC130015019 [Mercurialis annua]|uniref:uncharacterized protein LOC130015019 n=1 Tax=Mercurialis annua TaxID=3986 RepID=UPI0024AEFB61|nr:uncharacterized protein LOC130015019 [Mercurialis annua]